MKPQVCPRVAVTMISTKILKISVLVAYNVYAGQWEIMLTLLFLSFVTLHLRNNSYKKTALLAEHLQRSKLEKNKWLFLGINILE